MINILTCRKGVLTFDKDGHEERVLFLASKFYLFEKRLGTKQSLDQVILTNILTFAFIHFPSWSNFYQVIIPNSRGTGFLEFTYSEPKQNI